MGPSSRDRKELQRAACVAPTTWTQVFAGDAWGVVFDGTYWWATQGQDGDNLYQLDEDWSLLNTYDAGMGGGQAEPRLRGVTDDGVDLWVTGNDEPNVNDMVHRHDKSNGALLGEFETEDTGAMGLAYDGSDLWLSDSDTPALYRYTTSGSLQQTVPLPGARRGLAYSDGKLYVVDEASALVEVRDPSDGSVVATVGVSGATENPTGVWVSRDGVLYVSEDGAGVWRRSRTI